MSSLDEANLRAMSNLAVPLRRWIGLPISYNAIPTLAGLFDFVGVLLLGVGAGLAHTAHAGMLERRTYFGGVILIAALFTAFARAVGLHSAAGLLQVRHQIKASLTVWLAIFGGLAAIASVIVLPTTIAGAALAFFLAGIIAIPTSRIVFGRSVAFVMTTDVLARRRIVLVGTSDQLARNGLLGTIERCGYSVAQVFALPDNAGAGPRLGKSLSKRMDEVIAYTRSGHVDEIMLAIPWADVDLVEKVAATLKVLPIPVKLVPDLVVSRLLTRPMTELGPAKVLEIQCAPLSTLQRGVKQAMDQCLAAVGLVLLIPLFALTALAIRLDSPGPVFFRQVRVGFNERRFQIIKFRTMSTTDDGPVIRQASLNDARVTRLGRLLRKLSIDELPQLLNVLRGDMSLVGPRPHALAHDDEYSRLISSYAMRRKMKPGLTGWAQVNGCRGATPDVLTMQRRVDHDLWYIESWSFWLDIRILLKTAIQLLRPRDVY